MAHNIPDPSNMNRRIIHILADGAWMYDWDADDLDCEHLIMTIPDDWDEAHIKSYVDELVN